MFFQWIKGCAQIQGAEEQTDEGLILVRLRGTGAPEVVDGWEGESERGEPDSRGARGMKSKRPATNAPAVG